MPSVGEHVVALLERIERLEETVLTLTNWLVQAQSGLGSNDFHGIEKLVMESRKIYEEAASA